MRAYRAVPLPATGAAALLILAASVFACSQVVGPVATTSVAASSTQYAATSDTGASWTTDATMPGATPVGSAAPGDTAVPTPTPTQAARYGPTPPPATAGPTGTPAPTSTPGPTAGPTASPTPPARTGACSIFPSTNVWNRDVSRLPVASNSARMISAIGINNYLHPDFDAIGDGIPYNVVTSATPRVNVSFQYADESDPNPYPMPASPRRENGSDRHILLIDTTACRLWELYDAVKTGSGWTAGSGATWDLRSNALRPAGWTSADAAGLPIFPGLVRYEEVATGVIRHALRFTAPNTCGYIYPARHLTAPACSNLPPMGLRVRLKASVDISGFAPDVRVLLTALKRYGMILADNGSPWYISGAPSSHWNDDAFHKLQTLTGADFEVVDTSSLR